VSFLRRKGSAPAILMYHRVAVERTDPWGLCVSPMHFEEHLDALRRHRNVVSMTELHRRLLAGDVAPDTVALTFDDGYVDNLLAAEPLLRQYDVPATVFISSGYTDRGREFWWDELERIVLSPGDLPARMTIPLPGGAHVLDLGSSARYSVAAAARHGEWRAYHADPPTERHAAFLATWEQLVTLHDAEQWSALQSLRDAAGLAPAMRPSCRPMTAGEIGTLARGGVMEIGAHTLTHPALPALSPAEQEREIRDGAAALASILGQPVRGFSYPHGRFTEDTVRIVRDTGFAYACAGVPSTSSALDPFTLGRIGVPDCDGDRLLAMLTERARVG
jgi:peptidoglycan/xylan/chitin deacetylase (PgdA/CDA1 family)